MATNQIGYVRPSDKKISNIQSIKLNNKPFIRPTLLSAFGLGKLAGKKLSPGKSPEPAPTKSLRSL